MARRRMAQRVEATQSETLWDQRVQKAEQDYLACLAEFGCDSGEAFSALWHLRQLKRLAGAQDRPLAAA